jgi:muramoyltetrapeptide carboxypeptidase LdcA involved in peptidoglycan recycling
MRALEEDRIHPILMFPQTKTLIQLRAFWGVIEYHRIWILGYSDLARTLNKILKEIQ